MSLVDRLLTRVADRMADRLLPRINPPDPSRPDASPGSAAGWFTPGRPLPPAVPPGAPPRIWQYGVGINLWATPRGGEPISFAALQNLADSCDLVRICLEMRKDQLAGLEWTIKAKEGLDGDYEAQIAAAREFLERPDRENGWDAWLRMALEDVLVLDALSVYRRRTRGGRLYALEVIDGASIKPLLDPQGRTPRPPDPAYQQILHGVPYADLTMDDLFYRPKNRRARSAYGFSPVEWIVATIQWYVRRQQFNLAYYTEGNVPEGIASAPDGWTPDQIRQLEEWFNATIAGNLGEQRRIRFLGHGFHFEKTREMNFEVAFEEWLARVITAAFQVNYQRFIQRVVRATAEQAAAEQSDLGLEPLKRFVTNLMNEVLSQDLGFPDLRFAFVGGDQGDDRAQAEKRVAYVNAGIMARDEVREMEGLDPLGLPLTEQPTVTTGAGPVPLDQLGMAAWQPGPREPAAGAPGPDDRTDPTDPTDRTDAEKADLLRWKRKALKAVREGKPDRGRHFASAAIAPAVHAAIAAKLSAAVDESGVREAFEVASRPFRGGATGPDPDGAHAGRGGGVPYP